MDSGEKRIHRKIVIGGIVVLFTAVAWILIFVIR